MTKTPAHAASWLVLILAGASSLATPAIAAPPATITGAIADRDGRPLVGVVVIAAEVGSDRVAGMAVSDQEGRVRLALPLRPHAFGVLSPAFAVERYVPDGPTSFTLVLRPVPAAAVRNTAGAEAGLKSAGAIVVRGQVVDEVGAGLGGIRVEGVRPDGSVAAVTMTGASGRFALALPGGQHRLRASAPGLKAVGFARARDGLRVVLAVDVEPQELEIRSGHVLRFRTEDSIDPEYVPPPVVRAWLDYAYGICPSFGPLTAGQKRALKKYWYLDVLRQEPPNPATISTFFDGGCAPPASWEREPPAWNEGFSVLRDGGPPRRDPAAGP
jgi:hypothetical protein